ncbi:MAG TPA: peptidase [Phycisphaerae bacterium]|nr:peptidase [Phycisphaerae bacterium]
MTYCVGIITREGLVMASDSRTNAGYDQSNVCKKLHTFVHDKKRVLIALTSGSLSCTQSIVTLLERDFTVGRGLAAAENMYDAARIAGEQVRFVAKLDREALERDNISYNVHLLLGGQIGKEKPALYMVYPQGNPLCASEESPYLQIGESKYGRPILDRGVHFNSTPLEMAIKYALISIGSTMRSNVAVGPPVDMAVYEADALSLSRVRRFNKDDEDFQRVQNQWDASLRRAVQDLPNLNL